ncbi:dihydrolipoamide transacylase-like protein [Dinothrombium tinctorium]|uniref:Dihydrolipoamide transacylase-like protein n=1 Tax=Dinothrombium tinctorium TaxID=1965070 RepID=A0A443RP16_9ACAR|nr:dihydrolipoamide transacylase-like protein [Dinothrombium tinctorium]
MILNRNANSLFSNCFRNHYFLKRLNVFCGLQLLTEKCNACICLINNSNGDLHTRSVSTSQSVSRSKHLIGPSVRNLLHHYGIDRSEIKPSGPRNILLKSDVLHYIKQKNLKPGVSAKEKSSMATEAKRMVPRKEKFVDNELSNMRKTIAKRLTLSKTTIPHSYMTAECNISALLKQRQSFKKSGINVSVNDFVIKAVAVALKMVKEVNVLLDETKNVVKPLENVDISVAVATESGLITPIVKDANRLSVVEIGKTVKELADKAKKGKLQPHEFQGGTFSISNLGMFGITEFIAVINPPQSAILAVGTSRLTTTESGNIAQMMKVTLSYDARAIDEEKSAKFLEIFRDLVENPDKLDKLGDGSDFRRLNYLVNC